MPFLSSTVPSLKACTCAWWLSLPERNTKVQLICLFQEKFFFRIDMKHFMKCLQTLFMKICLQTPDKGFKSFADFFLLFLWNFLAGLVSRHSNHLQWQDSSKRGDNYTIHVNILSKYITGPSFGYWHQVSEAMPFTFFKGRNFLSSSGE